MPSSLLFTDHNDLNNLDTSSHPILQSTEHTEEKQEEQVNICSDITLTQNDSFLKLLKRLCIYWRRIFLNKIRLIFTLVFTSVLNITARITCFTRQRRPPPPPPPPSPSSVVTTVPSSALRAFEEEDLTDPSKSLVLIDQTHPQQITLPALQNSKMAHMLVQQQTHRSPSISIHSSNASQKDSKLPMTHSVDDRLFLHDSTRLLNLLTRFASEPQISKYHTQSTNTNGHFSKSPVVFPISSPVSNSYVPVNEPDKDEIQLEDIFYLNCDKIQPVSIASIEDLDSDKTDNISIVTEPLSEQVTAINGEVQNQQLDEDILFDTSPSINNNDPHCERHFRRRKRRSSLTKNSISHDDTPLTVDLLEKININQEQSPDITENLELKPNDDQQGTNTTETKISENEQSNETIVDDEKPIPVSRYRGRRLRHRFYRHATTASSPPEAPSNVSPQFYLPDEASNIEASRLHSPPPSPPITLSPLPSPVSPTVDIIPNQTSSNTMNSGLKRTNSTGPTKKNVRFADSVGRELAQVQYIRSSTNDESNELSFLLGSSLLSSSPPSFSNNHLYLPNTSRLEHKPWSFDVALTSNKQLNETPLPRRFFCLFRQPNSEHPDIYLHEIWKSQIKLEHADIPVQCSSTGEQQLLGTLWVTNASYWKYVSIKYTFNRWLNTYEHEAQHRCHSNDFRNIDQFEFRITLPADVDRIDFVLRYCVNGQEHWDNNEGKNYTLQTESAYTPSTTISLPHDCDFNEMRFY